MVKKVEDEEELEEIDEEEEIEEIPVRPKKAKVDSDRYELVAIPVQTMPGLREKATGRELTLEAAVFEILKKVDKIERSVA